MRNAGDNQLTFLNLVEATGHEDNLTLQLIDGILTQLPEATEFIYQDLVRGLKKPGAGKRGLSADRVLRSLVIMRFKNWTLRELAERISDGASLRNFARFGCGKVPDHNAFSRAFCRIQPETMQAINDLLIAKAQEKKVEDGKSVRTDTTVVETNVHYPTDASLLWDSVRVITRLAKRLQKIVGKEVIEVFDRSTRTKKLVYRINRLASKRKDKGKEDMTRKYREMLRVCGKVIAMGRLAAKQTEGVSGRSILEDAAIADLRNQLVHFCDLGDQVVDQAHRRIVLQESVPAREKIYSIFEPHTDLIKRGKANKPVEFGHKVVISETRSGIITEYRVLDGNPTDDSLVKQSLQKQRELFGRAPELFTGDKGFYSADNVEECRKAEVKLESMPKRGRRSMERDEHEKSTAFKDAQKFRAGVEGRISVLCRGRGMRRCPQHGRDRFEVFVGAVVFVNNLMKLADALAKKEAEENENSSVA